ncbi:hypothetical protein JKP88DRAFT_275572 [Tribonema minus]|uniref:Uncharacterized protein n=1 Tax=Tribonema minus TaxID=303371 RepID=A0A835Z9K4_9STRA|nr:hypothetical protein JKP88DRAFT_275572 [Tribonema minus]
MAAQGAAITEEGEEGDDNADEALLAAFAGNANVLSVVAERDLERISLRLRGILYLQRRPAADVARAREAAETQAQQICASVQPNHTGMQQARAMYDHEGQLLVALPQEVCGNVNALASRLVVVNVRRLLAALLIDHCALDGIFFELIDGDYEEIELAQVLVLHGRCCGGSRPWMRVSIPGNEGGRAAINVCFVVLYLVAGGLEIRLAAGGEAGPGV